MKRGQEPVDVTQILLELVRGLDFAFNQKSDEPSTPQTEQERYAGALVVIGRFLAKVDPDPTHADQFFVLSDALADHSIGARAFFGACAYAAAFNGLCPGRQGNGHAAPPALPRPCQDHEHGTLHGDVT